VVGHEAAGVVEWVGSDVSTVRPGDHVVASFSSCSSCLNCQSGHPAYCDEFFLLNLVGAPAGSVLGTDSAGQPVSTRWFGQSSFATHAVVNARSLIAVDRSLPLELLGPLGCGILTGASSVLNALHVEPGSSFAVIGTGTVGLSAIMAAQIVGADRVIAVDLHQTRLDLARELGAGDVIVADPDRLAEQLRDIAPGGLQTILDTTGVPSVISAAVDALRLTGTCGLVGVQRGSLKLHSTALSVGRTITGILVGDAVPSQTIPQLLDYWQQGLFPFDRLITQYPLSQLNEAERDMATGQVIKPVLLPGTGSHR